MITIQKFLFMKKMIIKKRRYDHNVMKKKLENIFILVIKRMNIFIDVSMVSLVQRFEVEKNPAILYKKAYKVEL